MSGDVMQRRKTKEKQLVVRGAMIPGDGYLICEYWQTIAHLETAASASSTEVFSANIRADPFR